MKNLNLWEFLYCQFDAPGIRVDAVYFIYISKIPLKKNQNLIRSCYRPHPINVRFHFFIILYVLVIVYYIHKNCPRNMLHNLSMIKLRILHNTSLINSQGKLTVTFSLELSSIIFVDSSEIMGRLDTDVVLLLFRLELDV